MRIKAIGLLLLTAFMLLSACNSQIDYSPSEDAPAISDINLTPTPPLVAAVPSPAPTPSLVAAEPTPNPYPVLPGKIAILTREPLSSDRAHIETPWIRELTNRYGDENILIRTWPWRYRHFTSAAPYTALANIANNPDIGILIISHTTYGADQIISRLRYQRDDIFIIYINDYPSDLWDFDISNPFQNIHSQAYANLILEFNVPEMIKLFPQTAYAMGATAMAYFYDSTLEWRWEDGELIKDEHVKSDRHILMRQLSEEIGLRFIEVDTYGEMQCGSSTAMYMGEVLPALVENYGPDIAFYGLCNWRVLWYAVRSLGTFYLPRYPEWFTPTPINIAHELSLVDWSMHYCDMYIITAITNALAELNQLGRVASLPMKPSSLFHLAAVEYGIRWMNGEALGDEIDEGALQQIMIDIICNHTGRTHGVTLTRDASNGNYIRVLMDYLIY